MRCACDFECTSSRDDGSVFDCVLDRTEAVAKGVVDLRDSVCVRTFVEMRSVKLRPQQKSSTITFDKESDALGFFDILYKRILLLSQSVFVYETGPSEHFW